MIHFCAFSNYLPISLAHLNHLEQNMFMSQNVLNFKRISKLTPVLNETEGSNIINISLF